MAKACSTVNVSAAKKATEKLLKDAEVASKKQPKCTVQLQSAKLAFTNASKASKGLEQRNAYIRASFHAGQALACGTVATIIETPGMRMKAKKTRKVVKKDV